MNSFATRMAGLDDETLFEVLVNMNDYENEAVEAAEAEISKRGGISVVKEKIVAARRQEELAQPPKPVKKVKDAIWIMSAVLSVPLSLIATYLIVAPLSYLLVIVLRPFITGELAGRAIEKGLVGGALAAWVVLLMQTTKLLDRGLRRIFKRSTPQ